MTRRRPKLFTPGPVEVPEDLARAADSVIHHRSALFRRQFARVREGLKRLFRTEGEVAVLAASGTGAMEAAAANLISPGDRVLVVRSGKFGGRWAELCRTYGARVEHLDVPPGAVVDPDQLEPRVDEMNPSVVFLVHSETSTGALNDVEAVARAVGGRATLAVDVVSSLGVHAFEMDRWGVGVAVAASQKGLGLPPGLGFVAVGSGALRLVEASSSPRYYFDLRRYLAAGADNQTPFTAPVTQIGALAAALRRLGSVEESIARHTRVAEAVRAGLKALGFEILPEVPSNAVTVVRGPAGLDASKLVRVLEEEFNLRIAQGQGELQGRVLRFGHLGWISDEDVIDLFEALEGALGRCGYAFEAGCGVGTVRGRLGSLDGG